MGREIRENEKELIALYTEIANQTVRELPEGWTNVGIGLAIDSKGYDTFLVYYSADGGKTYRDFVEESFDYDEPAEGIFEAKDCCLQLHELCKNCGDNWTQFALTVNRQGGFAADFTYEPIETFTKLDLQLWRGRYLK